MNLNPFNEKKLNEPEIVIIYKTEHKTKNDPICVQITKYRDACIALLLGLTKYTNKKDGISKHSYNKKKIIIFDTETYKYTIITKILNAKIYFIFFQ